MAGVDEFEVDTLDERIRSVETERLKLRERAERVRLAIQGQRRVVLRIVQPVRLSRIFFLQPRRVWQHQFAQIGRPWRAEHSAVIAVGDQSRQVPGVIEMSVRQNDARRARPGRPAAAPSCEGAALSAPGTARNRSEFSGRQPRAGTWNRSRSARHPGT